MDRLDDLLVFVEVVDGGNLSAAAERLGLSPSAISRRLSDLEARLGARLLNRTTRRVALTNVGASFCHRARAILAALDEAERAVTEMNETPKGSLRLSLPVMFGQMHVAPLLPDFLRRYPQVTLEVGLTNRMVGLIEDGVDVAIRIGRLSDSTLVARRLAPIRRAVLASPAYLDANGIPRTPADLAQHNCLVYLSGGSRQDWTFAEGTPQETARVSGALLSDSYDVLRQAALAGVGLVWLSTFVVASELKSGALVPVLTDYETPDLGVFALYPATRHLSPKVRAFIDHLLETIGQTDYWRRHELE